MGRGRPTPQGDPKALSFKNANYKSKKLGTLRGRKWRSLKQVNLIENFSSLPLDQPSFMSIKASPSLFPNKKYCDFSGFEANYLDPRTKMRYCNTTVFAIIRSLPPEIVQNYLEIRNAGTALK